MNIDELLHQLSDSGGSDLHLKLGSPPVVRLHGQLAPLPEVGDLGEHDLRAAFESLATPMQRQTFSEESELDFSYELADKARFRVNAARERGGISLAIRHIPLRPPSLEALSLPAICAELAQRRQGLVLVTGPTGSGKSTTLAAFIDYVNRHQARRIVTIEDPIEYVHPDIRSVITQREIGRDTRDFAIATRQSLRQDPDVILVGEMRDRETIAACLTAAETGHLVMSTLHTNNGPQTIDRIVDSFPAHQQDQIRMQLSMTLAAVLSQALLPRTGGAGRIAAVEVMLANSAIRNLIREGKTHQMASVVQTGRQQGMQTMDQALQSLVQAGHVSPQSALNYAHDPENFRSIAAGG